MYGETEPKMSGMSWLTGGPIRIGCREACRMLLTEQRTRKGGMNIKSRKGITRTSLRRGGGALKIKAGLIPFKTDQEILDEVVPSDNRQNMSGMGRKLPGGGSTSRRRAN
ncbi:hypothetical protein Tco_0864088, partial [Tanacetum coccineum]